MPELSVIVPVYNAEKYLNKCVDSILNQTYRDFELLLVDDGSPDQCGMICEAYAVQDSRVKVIHKPNGGVSEARNVGLDQAKGNYISFIDPDDWVEPDMFQSTIDFCKTKQTDIVCFEVCIVRKNKKKFHYRFAADCVFEAKDALVKILTDVIDNSPCNKIYRKAVWNHVRFPVGRRYEDVATIYKTFYNADRVGYIKKYFYYYVKHEGSAIALSFDAQRRYECFLGYKEQYELAKNFCKEAEELCKMQAVEAALSVITTLEAGCGTLGAEDEKNLTGFLHETKGKIKHLNTKNRILLWGVHHCPVVNKAYAKFSLWSKKLK